MPTTNRRKAPLKPYRKTKTKKKAKDWYQEITDKVITALEGGTAPWQAPVVRPNGRSFAYNYVSEKQYRGINFFCLNFFANYEHAGFMTFNQAKQLGGSIRKGAKSERVFFFKGYYKDSNGNNVSDERAAQITSSGGQVKRIAFLRATPVFNVCDVEGIDLGTTAPPHL